MLLKQRSSHLQAQNTKQLALSSAKPCVHSLFRPYLAVPFRARLASF